MKKCVVILIAALAMVSMAVGCKSASGCFSRNGSRVPTQSYASAPQSNTPVVQDQVIYSNSAPVNGGAGMGMAQGCAAPCSAVSQACEPVCGACNPCGACDPCSTRPQAGGTAYPGM